MASFSVPASTALALALSPFLATACGARTDLPLEQGAHADGAGGSADDGDGQGGDGNGATTNSGGAGGGPATLCGFSASYGDASAQYPTSMAVDETGAVVLAGAFYGTLDFQVPHLDSGSAETSPVIGGAVFVARLDPEGQTLWSHVYGAPEPGRTATIATDGADVLVAVSSSGPIDLGDGELVPQGSFDAFLAKVGPEGDTLWSRRLLADGAVQDGVLVLAMATDGGGNLVVFGTMSSDHRYLFVSKIDPAGSDVWTRPFIVDEGALITQDQSLAVDTEGNATLFFGVQGLGDSAVDLGSGPLVVPDQANNGVVAKLDAAGNLVYARLVDDRGGVGNSWASAGPIVAGPSGDVYLSYPFSGAVDLGTGELFAEGSESMLVAHLDAAGSTDFARAYGDRVYAGGVALGTDGRVLLGGTLEGTFDLVGESLANADGDSDVFIAALDATSGELVTARSYGDGAANILQLAVQPSGSLVVSGALLGRLQFCDETLQSRGNADVFVAQLAP